jgi:hypothetical protein
MDTSEVTVLFAIIVFAAIFMFVIPRIPRRHLAARAKFGFGDKPKHTDVHKDMVTNPRTKSEARAIHILKEITGLQFPTVNPSWLVWRGNPRELDGYNEQAKLALEFSGPLHTKWYPGVEPYEKYFARIVTDIAKRKLCARHNVDLIVIDMSLPQIHWKNYMLSRLYDFGRIPQKPYSYIDVQVAKPYRNKHIENDLGLRAEWKVVNKL